MEENPGVNSITSLYSTNGMMLITQVEIENVTNEIECSEAKLDAEDHCKEPTEKEDQPSHKSTESLINGCISPKKQIDGCITPEKQIDGYISPEKLINGCITPEKQIDPPEKQMDGCITPEKQMDGCVTPEKQMDGCIIPDKQTEPLNNEEVIEKPLVNSNESPQNTNGPVEVNDSETFEASHITTSEMSPKTIVTPSSLVEDCQKDVEEPKEMLDMQVDGHSNEEVIEVIQFQIDSDKECNSQSENQLEASSPTIDLQTAEPVSMQDTEDDKSQNTDDNQEQGTEKQKGVKTSREMKSLLASAKESKIISECTQLKTKTRKSKGTGSNTNLNMSIDSAMPTRRGSTTSQFSNSSGKSEKITKRSMRSQNPDFVSKQKLFLNSVTGKPARDTENITGVSNDVSNTAVVTPLAEISNELPAKETPKKSTRKKSSSNSNIKLPGVSKTRSDAFCWQCHWTIEPDPEQARTDRSADKPPAHCTACPRSFHYKCLSSSDRSRIATDGKNWACPECTTIVNVESSVNRSVALRKLSLTKLCELLQYAWNQLTAVNGVEHFMDPVDRNQFPDYDNYVVNPMCLNQIKTNISNKVYGSTEAFLSDVQWLVHNSIIFNAAQSKLTVVARAISRASRVEMLEIETCPECYAGAHARSYSFFTEVCSNPHILLWAKLKGFPYWPAKGMSINSLGQVDVRFFGAHDRARVPAKDCYLYSIKDPNNFRTKRQDILDSMQEAEEHVRNIARKYGKFIHAPFQTRFDPMRWNEQLLSLIPDYDGEFVSPRIDKLSNTLSPATVKTKSSKHKWYHEIESDVSGDESSRSTSVVPESNESLDRSLRRKLPTRDADTENKAKKRRKSVFQNKTQVLENKNRRRRVMSQEPEVTSTAPEVTSTEPEVTSTVPEVTSNFAKSRKRAISLFVDVSKEGSHEKSKQKKRKGFIYEDSDVPLGVKNIRKQKPSTEIPNEKSELHNEITQSLSEIPEFYIPNKPRASNTPVRTNSPKVKSKKGEISKTQENPATSTPKRAEKSSLNLETLESKENSATPIPKIAGNTTLSTPTDKLEDLASTPIFTSTEKKDRKSELKVKPIKLVRNAFNRKSLSIKHDSDTESIDSTKKAGKKDTSQTSYELTTWNKSNKANNKNKTNNNKSTEVLIPNVNANDNKEINKSNHTKVNKVSSVEITEKGNGTATSKTVLTTIGPKKSVEAKNSDIVIPTSDAADDFFTMHKINNIPGFPKVTQVRSLSKQAVPSVIIEPTTPPSKNDNKRTTKPKTAQNVIEKPKSGPKIKSTPPTQPVVGRVGVRSFARIQQSPERVTKTHAIEIDVKGEPIDLDEDESQLAEKIRHLQSFRLRPVQSDESGKSSYSIPRNVQDLGTLTSEPTSSADITPPAKPTLPVKIMPSVRHPAPTRTTQIRPVRLTGPSSIFAQPMARARMPLPVSISTSMMNSVASTVMTTPINVSASSGSMSVRMPGVTSVNGQWTLAIGHPLTNAVIVNGVVNNNNNNNETSTIVLDDSAGCSTPLPEPRIQKPLHNPLDPSAPMNTMPVPSSAGSITAKINHSSHKLTDFFRGLLMDCIEKLDTPASALTYYKLQVEQMRWQHNQEILELKHNHSLMLAEVRASIDKEKTRLVNDTRRACQLDLENAVLNAKSKQWCAMCRQEAKMFCCWNTSYCEEACQKKHWPRHSKFCTENKIMGNRLKPMGNTTKEVTVPKLAPKTAAEKKGKSAVQSDKNLNKFSVAQVVSVPTNTPATNTIISSPDGSSQMVSRNGGYLIVGATSSSATNDPNNMCN